MQTGSCDALNLGVCPCCTSSMALSFLSAALVVVVSARMFLSKARSGKVLKFLTWSCVIMNVAMAGFLVALKSNKDLQNSFFSKLCQKLASDPAMLPPLLSGSALDQAGRPERHRVRPRPRDDLQVL